MLARFRRTGTAYIWVHEFTLCTALLLACPTAVTAQTVDTSGDRKGSWEASMGTLGPQMFRVPGDYTAAFVVGHRWQRVLRRLDMRINAMYRPAYGTREGVGVWSSGMWRVAEVSRGALLFEPYALGGVGTYSIRVQDTGAHWGAGLRAKRARTSLALEWTQHPELRMSLFMLTVGLQPQ